MTLHVDAVRVLTRWHPKTDRQRKLQATFLEHLHAHADGLTRGCHPDHITASALVVSHDRSQVLLNLHRKYSIWMQFGGHCEAADSTLAAAALRESVEESGVAGLRLIGDSPVQLDIHEVQCGPVQPSHHLDVRYVAIAPADASAAASEESLEVKWFKRGNIPAGVDEGLRDLIDQSRWL